MSKSRIAEEVEYPHNTDHGTPVWHNDAACKGMSGGLADAMFYPIGERDPHRVARRELCFNICPVRMQCLAWGDMYSPQFGCWGGLAPEERRPRKQVG